MIRASSDSGSVRGQHIISDGHADSKFALPTGLRMFASDVALVKFRFYGYIWNSGGYKRFSMKATEGHTAAVCAVLGFVAQA